MSFSLEEVLSEYLTLKENNQQLDSSIQLTKAIREIYLEGGDLWRTPLFALMVETERKNITDFVNAETASFRLEYLNKKNELGNVIVSNINTFLMLKLRKNNLIEFTDSPIRLLKNEQSYYAKSILSMGLNELALILYEGEADATMEVERIFHLIELNAYEFNGIRKVVEESGSLLQYEKSILETIQGFTEQPASERMIPSWATFTLASMVLLNWYLNEMDNFKYLLLKLIKILPEEDNLYWLFKFLEKEFLLSE